jgi:chemotaxis protein CheC
MIADISDLSEVERDAISEIANLGVSRAAASLRQMVGEQVLLSVPAVRIVSRNEAAALVERGHSPRLVAVQQSFEGPFSGRALLIFPEGQSLELVRSIVGPEHPLEDLNACLATIANVLHKPMRMSLPSVIRGDGSMMFETGIRDPDANLVLFLYIDFTIKSRDIGGFIALLLDLPAIIALKEIVRDFIDGIDRQ